MSEESEEKSLDAQEVLTSDLSVEELAQMIFKVKLIKLEKEVIYYDVSK